MKVTLNLLGWYLHFESGLESELESESEDDLEYDSEETGVAEVSDLCGDIEHADDGKVPAAIGFRRMQ